MTAAVEVWDAIIVGGGPAGLSAALTLGRCRRHVLVCDRGTPRSWASKEMHGFISRDSLPPSEFLTVARDELTRYPTVAVRTLEVCEVRRDGDHFVVIVADGGVRCGKYSESSVPGVFAAGNITRDVQLAVVAAAEGAKAAFGINRALTRDDFSGLTA